MDEELQERIKAGFEHYELERQRIWREHQQKLAAIRDREQLMILLVLLIGATTIFGPVLWHLMKDGV